MGISRILEPKRGEMNYENMMERAVASDEKNSRVYNTKQVHFHLDVRIEMLLITRFLPLAIYLFSLLGNASRQVDHPLRHARGISPHYGKSRTAE